jgi:hypothetical protein
MYMYVRYSVELYVCTKPVFTVLIATDLRCCIFGIHLLPAYFGKAM